MKYSSTKKCASCKHKNVYSINSSLNSSFPNFSTNYYNLSKTNYNKFCQMHNDETEKFCLTFDKDICLKNLKNHSYHSIINNKDIIPPSEAEINDLKRRIKSYKDIFDKLLYEIKNWKYNLEKKIKILENEILQSKIINFIFNYNIKEKNIKNIIKFKEIFYLINKKEINIDDINDIANLAIVRCILSKNMLEYLISNKGDFIKNGISILKYLSEIKVDKSEDIINNNIESLEINISNLKKDRNKNRYIHKRYSTNTYNGYKKYMKDNEEINNSFNSYNSYQINSLSNILYSKKVVNNRYKINYSKNKLNKSAIIEPKKHSFLKSNKNIYNSNILLLKRKNSNIINNYKEIKYFTHKKYAIKDVINSPSLKHSINNININNEDNYYSNHYQNKNITIKKSKLIFKKLEISPIKTIQKDINILLPEEDKNKNFEIRIIKTTPEKKFIISPNKPIYIGLNLESESCQLSLMDQNTNDIQIISFKKNLYNFPMLIYLDEKSEEIKIGYDAEKENKKQIIYDLIKLYGKNSDEILTEKKYPFQLCKEPNGRIFIKLNYFGKKGKKFYVENLLILYFEHLFKKLFNRIIIEEDNKMAIQNNNISILDVNICVTIPIYFGYIKRKILEKIFQKHIFQNIAINKNYNNNLNCDINNNSIYCISLSSSKQSTASTINYSNFTSGKKNKSVKTFELQLNNLKIINSPNCSILCFQNNIIDNDNSNDESISSSFSFQSCSKENNILLLYISNDYISISINSINNQRVENNYKDKSKYHYIKKYQVKNNIDFNLKEKEINKNNILFDKIMLEIRNILIKSKISEISIDDIILIGDMSKSNYIKKKLSELFINNKIIYDKLNEYNFENDDYYLVSGAALESTSNTNKINNYIFNDICPISFGIENFNSKVDLLIKKGEKLPCSRRNFVKLYKGKNCDFVEVNIYEINGEKSQMMLSSSQLNCQKMKLFNDGYNKVGNNYVELLFEFDVDENSNLSVFILDIKSFKKKFEFAINIDVIKE